MEKLLDVIITVKPTADKERVLGAQDLFGEGILDSLDVLNLITELEAAYCIEINMANLSRNDLLTIQAINEMVKRNGG